MVKSAKILHWPWWDQQKVVVKQLWEEQSNVFDPTNQTKESMRVHLEKIMDNPLTSEEYYHLESKLDSLMEVVQTFEINHWVQRKVIWEENRI